MMNDRLSGDHVVEQLAWRISRARNDRSVRIRRSYIESYRRNCLQYCIEACTGSRSTPPSSSTLVMIDMRTASSRAATLSVISGSPSRRWMATFVSSRQAMPTGRRDRAVPHRRAARRTPHPWGGALPRLIKRAFQDVSRRTPRCGTTHSPAASPRSTAREHPRADVTQRRSRAPAHARSRR